MNENEKIECVHMLFNLTYKVFNPTKDTQISNIQADRDTQKRISDNCCHKTKYKA